MAAPRQAIQDAECLGRRIGRGDKKIVVHATIGVILFELLYQLMIPAGVYHPKAILFEKQRQRFKPRQRIFPFIGVVAVLFQRVLNNPVVTRCVLA